MPVKKHYSLEHADRVLRMIASRLKQFPDEVILSPWANGREQGYCLHHHRSQTKVVFAQQRNSDCMMFVHGPAEEFDVQTNQPDDPLFNKNLTITACDEEVAEAVAALFAQARVAAVMKEENSVPAV